MAVTQKQNTCGIKILLFMSGKMREISAVGREDVRRVRNV